MQEAQTYPIFYWKTHSTALSQKIKWALWSSISLLSQQTHRIYCDLICVSAQCWSTQILDNSNLVTSIGTSYFCKAEIALLPYNSEFMAISEHGRTLFAPTYRYGSYRLIIKIALWVSSTQSAFACVNIITYSPLCCQLFADILRKFYITSWQTRTYVLQSIVKQYIQIKKRLPFTADVRLFISRLFYPCPNFYL